MGGTRRDSGECFHRPVVAGYCDPGGCLLGRQGHSLSQPGRLFRSRRPPHIASRPSRLGGSAPTGKGRKTLPPAPSASLPTSLPTSRDPPICEAGIEFSLLAASETPAPKYRVQRHPVQERHEFEIVGDAGACCGRSGQPPLSGRATLTQAPAPRNRLTVLLRCYHHPSKRPNSRRACFPQTARSGRKVDMWKHG
jgi:hypothetical protein